MKLRVGFEMLYDFPQPTPMIMVLGTHFTRASDVIVPDFLTTDPVVEIRSDVNSLLTLVDVGEELVVLRVSGGGYDAVQHT